MTLKFILVGYREGKTEITCSEIYTSLKEANKAGNFNINTSNRWDHFTIVPVAIPNEDDLSLM